MENRKEEIFKVLCAYAEIRKSADLLDSVIGNRAYIKMQEAFVELVYKYNGIEYIKNQIPLIENEYLLDFLAGQFILDYRELTIEISKILLNSKNNRFVKNAQYTLKHNMDINFLDSVKEKLLLLKKKFKVE